MKRKRNRRPAEELSRRDFLKGAGVAVSSGLLTASDLGAGAPPESGAEVVGPGEVPITLRINGKEHHLSVEPRVTLLDALRDRLDLTGAKRVCDRGTCGSCTVMMDGKPIYACSRLAIEAEGHQLITIEGLAPDDQLHPVMKAFIENDAQQCGFCTPGFVVATTAFLKHNPHPTLAEVERGLGGNICRCGTYHGLRQAALDAAKAMKA